MREGLKPNGRDGQAARGVARKPGGGNADTPKTVKAYGQVPD
jgi:hypothetical protein